MKAHADRRAPPDLRPRPARHRPGAVRPAGGLRALSADADWLVRHLRRRGLHLLQRPSASPPARQLAPRPPRGPRVGQLQQPVRPARRLVGRSRPSRRVEVPRAYWRAVEKHWTELPDSPTASGATPRGSGRLTMTCAGIASLFVAHEYLEPAIDGTSAPRRPPTRSAPVRSRRAWTGSRRGTTRSGRPRVVLGLLPLRRRARRPGQRLQVLRHATTGTASWPPQAVDRQSRQRLLGRRRGRHLLRAAVPGPRPPPDPDEQAAVRPAGRLLGQPPARRWPTSPASPARQLERPLNWQVVNVENPWTDWTDSPDPVPRQPRAAEPDRRRRATSSARSSRPAGCSSPTPTRAPPRSTPSPPNWPPAVSQVRDGRPAGRPPDLQHRLQAQPPPAAEGRQQRLRGC